jgi:primosomal replication protein N
MYELRTAVMILVEVSWKDQAGISQTVSARMEDKSAGGACIRLKTAIESGSRLRIQSQWHSFSGVAKYCRSEGREFVVGVQRDTPVNSEPPQEATSPAGVAKTKSRPVISPPRSERLSWQGISPERKKDESPARPPANTYARAARNTGTTLPRGFGSKAVKKTVGKDKDKDKPRVPPPKEPEALPRTDLQTKPPPQKKAEAGKAWKLMARKWLDLKPWHNKAESVGVSGGNSTAESDESEREMTNRVSPSTEYTLSAEVVPRPAVELLPMEDICRSAGIMAPPKGYGINKVVEMINSEHVRGLSKELKRAAVLMALNAAGVPVGQVLQDYKSRQEALDFYEAAQKKQAEAEWARRAEEIVQIQAEMERVKEQFMARINRSLEGVAREKATFNAWQIQKQQETQNMSEAAELCARPVADGVKDSASEGATTAAAKPGGLDAANGPLADAHMAKAASAK